MAVSEPGVPGTAYPPVPRNNPSWLKSLTIPVVVMAPSINMETIIFTFSKKVQKFKIAFQQCSCNGSQKAATAEEQSSRRLRRRECGADFVKHRIHLDTAGGLENYPIICYC